MELENKIEVTIYRDTVEGITRQLTDKEWEVMSSELESALIDLVMPTVKGIYSELNNLVAEDSKYDEEIN